MKAFLDQEFLLETPTAQNLYHEVAENLPILDYHCHIDPREIAEDRRFENITQVWLGGDHYKWRLMRANGVAEPWVTGDAPDREKFQKWAETLEMAVGNPLYHWSMLELERVFGIDRELNPDSAAEIWHYSGECLKKSAFSAKSLLRRFHVEYAAPCMPITGNAEIFRECPGIVPSLRGDDLTRPSRQLLSRLRQATGIGTDSFDGFIQAAAVRLDAFHAAGCRFADHALDGGFRWVDPEGKENEIFRRYLETGETDGHLESAILLRLAGEYAQRAWTLQLHIGAERGTSTRLRGIAGPAGGYAAIAHPCDITSLTRMLDRIESAPRGLPRVILYTLNPADNASLAVLSGSYTEDGTSGKVQLGPAWWFCDHIHGMRSCFECIAAYGVLSAFIGMTTDSRSFLSFVRHEYFRRVFCGWIAEKADTGEMPENFDALKDLTEHIFYRNAEKLTGQKDGRK